MVVQYVFTEKEKQLITELIKMGNSFNYSMKYDDFRNEYKTEINSFILYGLLYHSNQDSDYQYITYSVSDIGIEAFKQTGLW